MIKANNENTLINNIKHLTEDSDYYLEYSNMLKEKAKLYSLYNENEIPSEISIKLIKEIINLEL